MLSLGGLASCARARFACSKNALPGFFRQGVLERSFLGLLDCREPQSASRVATAGGSWGISGS
jgi:hypothetical protein